MFIWLALVVAWQISQTSQVAQLVQFILWVPGFMHLIFISLAYSTVQEIKYLLNTNAFIMASDHLRRGQCLLLSLTFVTLLQILPQDSCRATPAGIEGQLWFGWASNFWAAPPQWAVFCWCLHHFWPDERSQKWKGTAVKAQIGQCKMVLACVSVWGKIICAVINSAVINLSCITFLLLQTLNVWMSWLYCTDGWHNAPLGMVSAPSLACVLYYLH